MSPVANVIGRTGYGLRRNVRRPTSVHLRKLRAGQAPAPHGEPGRRQMTAPRTSAPSEDEVRDAYLRVSHAFEGAREDRRRLYADYLQFFSADDVVLDFGCGDGTWLELLDGRGIKGVGIDYDPDKVAAVHARGLDAICS